MDGPLSGDRVRRGAHPLRRQLAAVDPSERFGGLAPPKPIIAQRFQDEDGVDQNPKGPCANRSHDGGGLGDGHGPNLTASGYVGNAPGSASESRWTTSAQHPWTSDAIAVEDRAVEVQLFLADRGHHRAPSVPDLLIAADFELIAVVTGQRVERSPLPDPPDRRCTLERRQSTGLTSRP
jgi:hypothetical protein